MSYRDVMGPKRSREYSEEACEGIDEPGAGKGLVLRVCGQQGARRTRNCCHFLSPQEATELVAGCSLLRHAPPLPTDGDSAQSLLEFPTSFTPDELQSFAQHFLCPAWPPSTAEQAPQFETQGAWIKGVRVAMYLGHEKLGDLTKFLWGHQRRKCGPLGARSCMQSLLCSHEMAQVLSLTERDDFALMVWDANPEWAPRETPKRISVAEFFEMPTDARAALKRAITRNKDPLSIVTTSVHVDHGVIAGGPEAGLAGATNAIQQFAAYMGSSLKPICWQVMDLEIMSATGQRLNTATYLQLTWSLFHVLPVKIICVHSRECSIIAAKHSQRITSGESLTEALHCVQATWTKRIVLSAISLDEYGAAMTKGFLKPGTRGLYGRSMRLPKRVQVEFAECNSLCVDTVLAALQDNGSSFSLRCASEQGGSKEQPPQPLTKLSGEMQVSAMEVAGCVDASSCKTLKSIIIRPALGNDTVVLRADSPMLPRDAQHLAHLQVEGHIELPAYAQIADRSRLTSLHVRLEGATSAQAIVQLANLTNLHVKVPAKARGREGLSAVLQYVGEGVWGRLKVVEVCLEVDELGNTCVSTEGAGGLSVSAQLAAALVSMRKGVEIILKKRG